MDAEEKFNAAVNIIRKLPKHGPYQPSNSTMLKFYAYYKQASEGPNCMTKPPFWDVVNKAKWDAWKKLGDMPKETAMTKYVEEFKKVVEKLTRTHDISNMSDNEVSSLYENIPVSDLQLFIDPSVIEKACSRPGSPFSTSPILSRETSPCREQTTSPEPSDDIRCKENGYVNEEIYATTAAAKPIYASLSKDEEDEESFVDTIENPTNSAKRYSLNDKNIKSVVDYGFSDPQDCWNYRNDFDITKIAQDKISRCSNANTIYGSCDETNAAVLKALSKLNEDVEKLSDKLSSVEVHLSNISKEVHCISLKYSKKFDRNCLHRPSPAVILLCLLSWPIIMQFIRLWFRRQKSSRDL